MNLYALDIPDNPAELAPWLERQLTGLHLAELVAELSAVHGSPAAADRSLDQVLGSHLPRALEHGLSAIPKPILRELLRNPRLLLEMQEHVLIDGGAYWDRLSSTSHEIKNQVTRDWQAVPRGLDETTSGQSTIPFRVVRSEEERAPAAARSRSQSWAVTITAAAAMLFIGFFLGDRFHAEPAPQQGQQVVQVPPPTAWGWQKPGAMEPAGTQAEYLTRLADSADEWFKKRPDTPAALAKRIGEFREGCTALLLAEHNPLTAETRDWLRERCRVWAGKLDGHRNELEAGEEVQRVRDAADETVKKLIQAIRTKATEVTA